MSNPELDFAVIMAGIPATNLSLYHRIRFLVGDPAALIEIPAADGNRKSTLILRDIEMDRARQHAQVNHVACPADFKPATLNGGPPARPSLWLRVKLFAAENT